MNNDKVFNRWLVVVGALIIQVSLGAVYIWSVFQTPLKSVFPTWSETQVTLPAQVVLAAFALAVIFGGRFQDRYGPRIIATIGGVVLGAGLVLARFTGNFGSGMALLWLLITFSILGGLGIGMAYVCPIATCVKWFPDKRGLITGLAVAGFGAGAFFFAPLAKGFITGGKYQILGTSLFGLPKLGVFNTFMALGIIFLVAVVLAAQLLRNPPAGYRPAGWNPPAPPAGAAPVRTDYTPGQMLATPQFWLLWLVYFAGCTAGLQVIMKASPVWQSCAIGACTPPVDPNTFGAISSAAAMAVSILAIFNAVGRIFWGKVSDSAGRKPTLVVMLIICAAAMFALDFFRAYGLYLVGISVVGLCFGGYLALFPAFTADFFGTKHYGVNYGWMFSAYGAGGIVGPFLAALLMKVSSNVPYQTIDAAGSLSEKLFTVGNYRPAFYVAAAMCVVAVLLTLLIKPPKRD